VAKLGLRRAALGGPLPGLNTALRARCLEGTKKLHRLVWRDFVPPSEEEIPEARMKPK